LALRCSLHVEFEALGSPPAASARQRLQASAPLLKLDGLCACTHYLVFKEPTAAGLATRPAAPPTGGSHRLRGNLLTLSQASSAVKPRQNPGDPADPDGRAHRGSRASDRCPVLRIGAGPGVRQGRPARLTARPGGPDGSASRPCAAR